MVGRVENWIPGANGIQFEVRGCPRTVSHVLSSWSPNLVGNFARAPTRSFPFLRLHFPPSHHLSSLDTDAHDYFSDINTASVFASLSIVAALLVLQLPACTYVYALCKRHSKGRSTARIFAELWQVRTHFSREKIGRFLAIKRVSRLSRLVRIATLRPICALHILLRTQARARARKKYAKYRDSDEW